jgi:hypothetical protein
MYKHFTSIQKNLPKKNCNFVYDCHNFFQPTPVKLCINLKITHTCISILSYMYSPLPDGTGGQQFLLKKTIYDEKNLLLLNVYRGCNVSL